MFELLKTDFKRVLKDKLLLVVLIIALVFAVSTPLLYRVLLGGLLETPELAALGMNLVSAKTQFFTSFSLSNNLGIISPILLALILCKDFSHGTVRNKIIAGKSRHSIFFSLYIVCAVVLWGVTMIYSFLTLGVSLLFFDYQSTEFTSGDFAYFMQSLLFELLVYLFVAAVISFLCAAMKNAGLVTVMYIAIMFVLIMVAPILQVIISLLSAQVDSELLVKCLTFLNRINIFIFPMSIGSGTSYQLKDVLYFTITPVVGIGLVTGLGTLIFRKKDLK